MHFFLFYFLKVSPSTVSLLPKCILHIRIQLNTICTFKNCSILKNLIIKIYVSFKQKCRNVEIYLRKNCRNF